MGYALKFFVLLLVGYVAVTAFKRLLNAGVSKPLPQAPPPTAADEGRRAMLTRRLKRGFKVMMLLLCVAVTLKIALLLLMTFSPAHGA
ncbi:MAG: hypothetical protein EON92_06885 [Burkholderiales bacterium]|nr:MAG: hypothetical protein EON92_06885 [Burkholderiales bacterium]